MIVYISVIVKTVIQFLKLLCLDSTQENWILTELLPKQLQWSFWEGEGVDRRRQSRRRSRRSTKGGRSKATNLTWIQLNKARLERFNRFSWIIPNALHCQVPGDPQQSITMCKNSVHTRLLVKSTRWSTTMYNNVGKLICGTAGVECSDETIGEKYQVIHNNV